MAYDADWVEDTKLADGTPVRMRLVRPGDKAMFLAAWERVSPQARYRRFLSHKDWLSEAELAYLTETDGVNHVAIGIARTDAGVEQAIGVARFIRLAGPEPADAAEAAIVVVDDMHGRGVGSLLLSRLAAAALERGVARFQCDVLAENTGVRELLRKIAPQAVESADGELVRIDAPLVDMVRTSGERNALYRLLALFAKGAVALRDGLFSKAP